MVLRKVGEPLVLSELPSPVPGEGQVHLKVLACAVCRTDLHIVDGELPLPNLPLVLGHQVVGETASGKRLGAAWLGNTCGVCSFCKRGEENLCDSAIFNGYSRNGGFAEEVVVDQAFTFPLSKDASPEHVAPLLCAGMIGYRTLKMAGDAKRVGFYGFGAAAHLLIQLALYQEKEVYAFTKPGDAKGQDEARKRGATWAGPSDEMPPELLDAALIFAPVGELVPLALKAVRKGGSVVCGGIHMSDIPSFPYEDLWEERKILSVANLTRRDGEEFLKVAREVPIQTEVTTYPLEEANQALDDLRSGLIRGSAVLIP